MSLVNMQGKFIVKAGGAGGGGGISAPSNVSISSKTSSGFTVSWNAVASALGYKLDVATDSGFSSFVTGYNGKDVAGTSQAVTGLTQNTTYYVRVRAVATGSNSGSVSDTTETATLPLNAGLRNGLQAFYKLDDTTDASGNGNTLTNVGSVTFSSGKIGNAAVLTNGTLSNNSLDFNGLGGLSVSAWVKVNNNNSSSWCFISKFSDYNGGQLFFGNNNANSSSLRAILNVNGSFCTLETSNHNVFDGNWHFVTLNFDGQNMKMYVDGQVQGTQAAVGTISNSSASFVIGGSAQESYPTGPFNGEIDAVGIWNRALTESEITELYNSGSGLE